MSKSMLNLDGKRFAVLPENEYRSLVARAAKAKRPPAAKSSAGRSTSAKPQASDPSPDAGDVAEARRRLADPTRIAAADLFHRLGW